MHVQKITKTNTEHIFINFTITMIRRVRESLSLNFAARYLPEEHYKCQDESRREEHEGALHVPQQQFGWPAFIFRPGTTPPVAQSPGDVYLPVQYDSGVPQPLQQGVEGLQVGRALAQQHHAVSEEHGLLHHSEPTHCLLRRQVRASAATLCNTVLHHRISREKFEPEPGFELGPPDL